jgi:hypothetical protein
MLPFDMTTAPGALRYYAYAYSYVPRA